MGAPAGAPLWYSVLLTDQVGTFASRSSDYFIAHCALVPWHLYPPNGINQYSAVQRSENRILTTHTGSLPRSAELRRMLAAREREEDRPREAERFETLVRDEVDRVVQMQVETGIDVLNDGEQGKASFHRYRLNRLSGFEAIDHTQDPTISRAVVREALDFPEFYERWTRQWRGSRSSDGDSRSSKTVCCTGPIGWKGFSETERDIANLIASTRDLDLGEVFMTSISPTTYAPPNVYYPSQDDYLDAMADAMAVEYEAIVEAGLLLQIDAPDLTTMYRLADLTFEEYATMTERGVATINRATRNIAPDRIRVHVCWGADEAPHNRDVPLRDIVDMLLKLRPQGLAVPGANGRHSHEWSVWRDVRLPDDKVLIPGVIDSTTNIIEHPEAVAERIVRYAGVVGTSQLVVGVDCGFGTVAGVEQVDERVVWAKLGSLVKGARLASLSV